MNDLVLRDATSSDIETLVYILHDADKGDARIRAVLNSDVLNSYAVWEGQELVGAAVVRWADVPTEESEIILLAAPSDRRGQGIGTRIILALVDEARRRSVCMLLVGTGSLSLDNIAFYQKCGFRMHHVRRDYFEYIRPPLVLGGVTLRDMIVFDYNLEGETQKT